MVDIPVHPGVQEYPTSPVWSSARSPPGRPAPVPARSRVATRAGRGWQCGWA